MVEFRGGWVCLCCMLYNMFVVSFCFVCGGLCRFLLLWIFFEVLVVLEVVVLVGFYVVFVVFLFGFFGEGVEVNFLVIS